MREGYKRPTINTSEESINFRPFRKEVERGTVTFEGKKHTFYKKPKEAESEKILREALSKGVAVEAPFKQHEGDKTIFLSEGANLESILLDKDIAIEKKRFFVEQSLSVLRDFHRAGFFHPDIQPSNFAFDKDKNKVTLLDASNSRPISIGLIKMSFRMFSNSFNNYIPDYKIINELILSSIDKYDWLSEADRNQLKKFGEW